jgi:hypothetical protein
LNVDTFGRLWEAAGARVAMYRHELNAGAYVVKGLGYASRTEQNYEMKKFASQRCDLILSDSF